MTSLMLSGIQVKHDILSDDRYKFLFSVEEVNKLVISGVPFRDAYKQIGTAIEKGEFKFDSQVQHTHEGSIGNLSNDKIKAMMEAVLHKFQFEQAEKAIALLLR